MGVTIKRKSAPEASPLVLTSVVVKVSSKNDQGLTPRQQEAVNFVFGPTIGSKGGAEEPVVMASHGIEVGDTVQIITDKFYWVTHFKKGDEGTVTYVFSEKELRATYPGYDPAKDCLYKVRLNNPRVPTVPIIEMPLWGLTKVSV